MFEFQKLDVYKKSKLFHLNCKKLFNEKRLENYEKSQIGRASFSIVLNIAEGSGKFSKADRRNYFVIARGSVFECVAAIEILHDQKIISKESFDAFTTKADELSRMLYAMIKNLSGIQRTE